MATPFNSSDYESPYRRLLFSNFLKRVRLEREVEVRELELKNHRMNMRRYLMEEDSEIAGAYNKAYSTSLQAFGKEEDIPKDQRWKYYKKGNLWEVFPWIKPFYLGRILTNPLNNYSSRTDEENYVEPLFGSLVEVSNNIKLKKEFCLESLKYYNNLDWFTKIYWTPPEDSYLDSRVLKISFIDPLKAKVAREKDYQEYTIRRAQAMESGFTPKPRG
jgi:hypothetical protein